MILNAHSTLELGNKIVLSLVGLQILQILYVGELYSASQALGASVKTSAGRSAHAFPATKSLRKMSSRKKAVN